MEAPETIESLLRWNETTSGNKITKSASTDYSSAIQSTECNQGECSLLNALHISVTQ
jgi:hypothetical protein